MAKRGPSLEDLTDLGIGDSEESRAEVERALKEFPDRASDVRPLLAAAGDLRQAISSLEPRPAFARQSELRLWNRIRERRRPVRTEHGVRPGWQARALPALLAAGLVAAVALGSLGLAQASAASLPGDRLYSLKRGIEELRLGLSLTPGSDEALLGGFADERLNEIESLAAAGRMGDLEQALDGYALAIGRLARAVDLPAHGGQDEVLDMLTHHIAVLEKLQLRLPAPAKAAIERAIERSIDAETTGRPEIPTPAPGQEGCLPGDCGASVDLQGQDQRMSDQIAKIYGVPPEQVMATYRGECLEDWKCVRTHFREGNPKNPHRP